MDHRVTNGADAAARSSTSARALAVYLTLGAAFGVVITKAQVVSWFRIQEMFRFQSFHMFGVMGSAVLTAAIGLMLIRRFGVTAASGEPIVVPPKALGSGTRYWAGGAVFGLGWAISGSCPGPLLALIGQGIGDGVSVLVITLASAVIGTWCYSVLRPHLPH
jgi:uncharacterized protein